MRKLTMLVVIAVLTSPLSYAEPPAEPGQVVDSQATTVSDAGVPARSHEIDERRSEEMRALVDQVLRDADARAHGLSRVSLGLFQDEPATELPDELGEDFGDDATGTDPRGFGNKLMPYYRYAEAKNGLEIQQFVLFGMIGFTPDFAMTYEWPLAKKIDYGDLLAGGIPPGGDPPFPPGGVPPGLLDPSGEDTGMGDLNLRFFWKVDALQDRWGWEDDLNPNKGWAIMPLIETTLPTATEDALGGEAWILSPGFAFVTDLPGGPPLGLGFLAMMNFFDFDVFKDDSREKVRRFRGRWFWMQPLTKPGPNITDGLYVLTELQPIYDFENSDFDLWIGPEFGKVVTDGFIIYGKPGWGIDPDPEDREFTFEVGLRYFF